MSCGERAESFRNPAGFPLTRIARQPARSAAIKSLIESPINQVSAKLKW